VLLAASVDMSSYGSRPHSPTARRVESAVTTRLALHNFGRSVESHSLRLPPFPAWVTKRPECSITCGPPYTVALDTNGDIVVAMQAYDSDWINFVGLVRFDPTRRQWLPGGVTLSSVHNAWITSILAVGNVVWMTGYSGAVLRGSFSSAWASPKVVVSAGRHRPWGFVNRLAADGTGGVWMAGSTARRCPPARASTVVCGRSEIGHASPKSVLVRPLRASRSGTVTDMAVGPGGSVWLVVPRYRRCAGQECARSALIRYDPGAHRFTKYLVPPRAWPDVSAVGSYWSRSFGRGWTNTAWVYPRANGVVWIIAVGKERGPHLATLGLRIIRFQGGSFRSKRVDVGAASFLDLDPPVIDRNRDLWFCDSQGRSIVIELRSGATRRAGRGGAILTDSGGLTWIVNY
jgi:hypothetical protein